MKNLLIATTALVATASVAAADVTFSGYGRFGVQYTDAGGSSTDLTSRLRLQIDASAESDGGVTMGARVRIQQNAGGSDTGVNGTRFFVRSGGVEVGAGNIFGALEFMPGMYPIDLGLTGLGYDYTAYAFNGDAYSSGGVGSGGSNGVEVMYSAGGFGIHISASDTNNRRAAHFKYSVSDVTFALGLQDSDLATDTETAASISGKLGGANLTLSYADNGTSGDHTALAGSYAVGAATTLSAYAATADAFVDTSFGIGAHHDLGGGTSIRGGYASLGNGDTRADLGVRFNF